MTDVVATFYISIEDKDMADAKRNQFRLRTTQGDLVLPLPKGLVSRAGTYLLTCLLVDGQWQALSIHPIAQPMQSNAASPMMKANTPTQPYTAHALRHPPAPAKATHTAKKAGSLITPPPAALRNITAKTTPKAIDSSRPPASVNPVAKAKAKPVAISQGGFYQNTLTSMENLPVSEPTDPPRPTAQSVPSREPVIHVNEDDGWDSDDVILF